MHYDLGSILDDLDRLAVELGWDPKAGLQLVDGAGLAQRHHPDIDPARPALVRNLSGPEMLLEVAATLGNQYAADHPLILLQPGEVPTRSYRECALAEIPELVAEHGVDQGGGPWLLAVAPLSFAGSMLDLAEVIAHLRAPDGCPWDREQTHRSLRPYMLEEAYEAVEAIDVGDMDTFADELGDVLLQVVLHAQVAVEDGSFKLPDVIRAITEKLIRRHPHVFGDVDAETPAAVVANWEQLKKQERAEKGGPASPFAGIPTALPSLARAEAALEKAGRHGATAALLPDHSIATVRSLLEAAEISAAGGPDTTATRDAAFGEALLRIVALARALDIDPETVLRERVTHFLSDAEARLSS